MKKCFWLSLIIILAVCGCVSVNNSTSIDTDQQGNATGQYRDVHCGKVADVGIFGGGGGGGASDLISLGLTAASAGTSSGAGAGMVGLRVKPAPSQGNPLPFARAIAMLNYSKKLKSIKYDEVGGVIQYEFESQPMGRSSSVIPPAQSALPKSFGHQPVE